MFSHPQIWNAIDNLAKDHSLSASGLAKLAGLDPTAFNKSKRLSSNGKPRWPSTESISKILAATNKSLEEFSQYLTYNSLEPSSQKIEFPILPFSHACSDTMFNANGLPIIEKWKTYILPDLYKLCSSKCFILEIDTYTYDPYYRIGNKLLLNPDSKINEHDRAIIRVKDTIQIIEVADALNTSLRASVIGEDELVKDIHYKDIKNMYKIEWVSQ